MSEQRITRLKELSRAAAADRDTLLREYTMRIPADPNRDVDLVISWAADALKSAPVAKDDMSLDEVLAFLNRWNEWRSQIVEDSGK